MRFPFILSLGLAVLALGVGFSQGGLWPGAGLAGLVGLAVALAGRRDRAWPATVGLAAFTGLAGWGAWWGLAPLWMLAGLTAALAAWDLDHFYRRFEQVPAGPVQAGLERLHWQRLLSLAGLSLLLGGLALNLRLELGFGWALLLGLLAVLALSRAIRLGGNKNR